MALPQAQQTFNVDTNATSDFRKVRIFMGGIELDLSDPENVRTLGVPLSSNIEFWIILSQDPVSGYDALINPTSGKVHIPVFGVGGDLPTKVVVQTFPELIAISSVIEDFTLKTVWNTNEATPIDANWVLASKNVVNKTIGKLDNQVPLHTRIAVEYNPYGGSADTLLEGKKTYDAVIASSILAEQYTYSNAIDEVAS